MADYGFEKNPPRPLMVATQPPWHCMVKHCPNQGVHHWVEPAADMDIVVAGEVCSLHKEYLESLARRGYLVEWVTGV